MKRLSEETLRKYVDFGDSGRPWYFALGVFVTLLIVQTALIPLISVQVISSNYFQATGQPLKSAFLSLTRQLIFLLPAFLITPTLIPSLFPGMTPLMGYCFSFPIADGLSVLLSALLLVIEVRKQHRRIAEAEAKGAVTK